MAAKNSKQRPSQPVPRKRPAVILEEARILIRRHQGGDETALSPKKVPGARGGIWAPNEVKYLLKSALYYKPEIKGPFLQGEQQKAIKAAAWSLVTQDVNVTITGRLKRTIDQCQGKLQHFVSETRKKHRKLDADYGGTGKGAIPYDRQLSPNEMLALEYAGEDAVIGVRGIQVPPLGKCSTKEFCAPVDDNERIWVSAARQEKEHKEKENKEKIRIEKATRIQQQQQRVEKKIRFTEEPVEEEASQEYDPSQEHEASHEDEASRDSLRDDASQELSQQQDPHTQDFHDFDETYDDYAADEGDDCTNSFDSAHSFTIQNAAAQASGFTIPRPLRALCGHPAKRKLIETGNFVPPSALQTNSEKWFNRSVDEMRRGSQAKKTTAETTRKGRLSLSLSQGKKTPKKNVATSSATAINISPIPAHEDQTSRFQSSCEDTAPYEHTDDELAEPLDDSDGDPTYTPTKEVDDGKDDDEVSLSPDLPTQLKLMRTSSTKSRVKPANPQPSTSRYQQESDHKPKKHVPLFLQEEAADKKEAAKQKAKKHVPAFLKEERKVAVKPTPVRRTSRRNKPTRDEDTQESGQKLAKKRNPSTPDNSRNTPQQTSSQKRHKEPPSTQRPSQEERTPSVAGSSKSTTQQTSSKTHIKDERTSPIATSQKKRSPLNRSPVVLEDEDIINLSSSPNVAQPDMKVSGSSARNVRDSSPSLLTGKVYAPRPAAADVERVCADMADMKKLHVTIAALMEHHNTAITTVLTNNNTTNAKLCEVLVKVSELMETDTRRYGTQTDDIRQVHVGTQVDVQPATVEVGVNTDLAGTAEVGVNTDVAATVEVGVNTDVAATVDVHGGVNIKVGVTEESDVDIQDDSSDRMDAVSDDATESTVVEDSQPAPLDTTPTKGESLLRRTSPRKRPAGEAFEADSQEETQGEVPPTPPPKRSLGPRRGRRARKPKML